MPVLDLGRRRGSAPSERWTNARRTLLVWVALKSRARPAARHLLSLLGADLCQLLLAALLAGDLAGLGVEAVVPPAEARGIVADEALVVHVVVVGAGPKGQEVAQAPGEVVAAVGIDGLEESEDDPHVHGKEMKLPCQTDPDDGGTNDADA